MICFRSKQENINISFQNINLYNLKSSRLKNLAVDEYSHILRTDNKWYLNKYM